MKTLREIVNLIVFGIMIFDRAGSWCLPWLQVVFWTCAVVSAGFWLSDKAPARVVTLRSLAICGMWMNAIVEISNGMFMPVVGMKKADGCWRPAVDADSFQILEDRYAGFSLGDFMLISMGITSAIVAKKTKVASGNFPLSPLPFLAMSLPETRPEEQAVIIRPMIPHGYPKPYPNPMDPLE